MTLEARLGVRRGSFTLDAAFVAERGSTLALAGPSGAGKSTAVRVVAGVLALDSGRLAVGGETWDDPVHGDFVVPERRRVGWMPQGASLFPHLDVGANVAFPLRSRGVARRAAERAASEWIERLGLAGRDRDRPGQLSGGEAQRVALARALVGGPRVVLLDEPFTGLDLAARVVLRRVLREALAGADAVRILVAHEPLDALALAERFVVLEGGSVVQAGSAEELCERPRTPYVADLAGLNLVEGIGRVVGGRPVVEFAGGSLQVAETVAGPVVATFRPSAVAVFREPPGGSPRNALEGVVSELVPSGERVRVRIQVGEARAVVAELTAEAAAALDLATGERVYAVVKATEIDVLPA